ncbi:hypothetical protein GDO78_017560 [Eleutherodactylus coqui]|uniref:Uncharacterized protein n=1 Tax=Eleutherodactylus coqui TaxID=57060 RepID=A0A8J6BAD5_ELECQ|nr:hypothetical protein GDO78_017560 [Eleutherodactylus coqui]
MHHGHWKKVPYFYGGPGISGRLATRQKHYIEHFFKSNKKQTTVSHKMLLFCYILVQIELSLKIMDNHFASRLQCIDPDKLL